MMLKEMEWLTINNILLELYRQKELSPLVQKLMRVLRMLIPYTKGYMLLLDHHGKVKEDTSCFIGMQAGEVDAYLHKYYSQDYLQYLYEISSETQVYRDTDILDDERREKTDFFRKFLLPADIPYGCGIIVRHEGCVFAIVNLFRNKELGDFTDKDIEILNILKKHVENMLVALTSLDQRQQFVEQCCDEARECYGLTERESEVLRLLTEGLSNSEICERMTVSISTVKKHIYHLFGKMQVKSRTQLIHQLYLMQEA